MSKKVIFNQMASPERWQKREKKRLEKKKLEEDLKMNPLEIKMFPDDIRKDIEEMEAFKIQLDKELEANKNLSKKEKMELFNIIIYQK